MCNGLVSNRTASERVKWLIMIFQAITNQPFCLEQTSYRQINPYQLNIPVRNRGGETLPFLTLGNR